MKRIASTFAIFLIICSSLIPAFSFAVIPEVKGAEQVIFEDNFEKYAVGTFPSSGGWELWYDGAGTEQQIIVGNVSFSPAKSLKLFGVDFWAAFAAKRFVSASQMIGFEVSVRVEETNGQSRDNARVAFTTKVSSFISREYAPVTFDDDGKIVSGGQVLQSYVADTWYTVKLLMDRSCESYSVWIDGELKGENLTVTTTGDITNYPSSGIEAFSVSQCYNSVTAYFDDVKIFSAFEANPKLELVPTEGIAATTLVGSGFAPNSQISVTWDGTPIPTVPSPLVSDGYGNFTGIISVLDQTKGTYTIKTVDETGNEATAVFTVNIEAPSQTADEQNNGTPFTSDVPASLKLLGGGARWAAEDGSSALLINWKDTWLAHHLTDGASWNPWPLESKLDRIRDSIAYTLEQADFDVDFAGDIPETLTGYDLVVIESIWAVEPKHASLIADFITDGGGVVILGGVPCYFSVYCKDFWPYRASGSEFDGHRFGLAPIQEWFGARYYINVDGYPHLAFENPFGTSLSFGDSLMDVESEWGASVTSMSSNTQIVATWESGYAFSFTHEYGQGRLYYQARYEYVPEDILAKHELVVNSSPINEVFFKVNGKSQATPYSVSLSEESYTIEMPETQDGYIWSHWLDDGDTNRTRTVSVNENVALTAIFTPQKPSLTCSVLSPENRTYNTADIPLTLTKNETCYYLAYSLDGQPVVDSENITALSDLTEGTHQLSVYANYTGSHVGESVTVWFTVDTSPPDITDVVHAPVNINGTLEEGAKVNATVTDAISGVERVVLNFTDDNGTWTTAEMSKLEDNVWNGTLPAFPHGTNVTYTIIAEDKAGNAVTTMELYGEPNQYEVLPEFPLWIILPLFLVATATTFAARKRLKVPAFAKTIHSIHEILSLRRHQH